jgi:methylenetetrahydrofolate reductase (NADPH)
MSIDIKSGKPSLHQEIEQHIAAELVRNGSIELTSRNPRHVAQAAELLPFGTSVYLPARPEQTLSERLELLRCIHESGLNPVPHLSLVQIGSRGELKEFLERAAGECGVHRVHLIGGEEPGKDVEFADSTSIIRDGILAEAGISDMSITGYPEGHPRIELEVLQADFQSKLEQASAQGLGIDVLTQFSFAPSRLIEYCSFLDRIAPEINLYISLAGPASDDRLARYAQRRGISPSLRGLDSLGVKAAADSCHTDPDEQLTVIARHCAMKGSNNIIGIHMLSLGGFLDSARWMQRHC